MKHEAAILIRHTDTSEAPMKAELEKLIEQMIDGGILYEEAVREFEKRFILNVLQRHNHNLSRAATALGIHRNTLSKRLEEYENLPGDGASRLKTRKQIATRFRRGH